MQKHNQRHISFGGTRQKSAFPAIFIYLYNDTTRPALLQGKKVARTVILHFVQKFSVPLTRLFRRDKIFSFLFGLGVVLFKGSKCMKGKNLSVFHKVVTVVGMVCAVAYLCIGVCSVAGLLPSLSRLPYAHFLFGMLWLCQGILNWKTHRVLAGFDFAIGAAFLFLGFAAWVNA